MPIIRCPYCVEGGQFKVMVAQTREDCFTCARCNHTTMPSNNRFPCTCPNCILVDVRHGKRNAKKIAGLKNTPQLVIETAPSGSPLLRGSCSICPGVMFAIVGDTEENRRRMQQAFDKHFREIHHLNKDPK